MILFPGKKGAHLLSSSLLVLVHLAIVEKGVSEETNFTLPEEYRRMTLLSGESFGERAGSVMTHMGSLEVPSENIDFKSIGPYLFAKMMAGEDLEECNARFDTMLDQAFETLPKPTSYNHFFVHSAMHGFLLNEDKISAENTKKLKHYLSSTEPKVHIKGTINMTAMYASGMLLACEKWPEMTAIGGHSNAEVADFCRGKVMELLHDFFYRNTCEIDAFTYFATNLPWVRMLAEFSTDRELRSCAEATYQKMIATLVAPWNQGYYNNPPYRSKGWHNLLTGPHEMNAINQVAWVYFGNPSNRLITFDQIGRARASLPNHVFWISYPRKVKPKKELLDVEESKDFPYEFTTTMLDHGATYHKYTYQSENYGQSSQTEILDDLPNAPMRYGYKEVKRNLLQWKSETKHCVFSVCQDNPERPTDLRNRNPFGYGENPFHRVFQHKTVTLGVYSVPEDYLDGKYHQIYVPFSKRGINTHIEKDGWVFCHTGTMMFAFRTLAPYVWNKAIFAQEGYEILSPADKNLRSGRWILETTEITERFRNDSPRRELESFAGAILSETSFESTGGFERPKLLYKGHSGAVLEIEFFPPTEPYEGQYKLNGESVPLEKKYILNSPYIQQTSSSPVSILNGQKTSLIEYPLPSAIPGQ